MKKSSTRKTSKAKRLRRYEMTKVTKRLDLDVVDHAPHRGDIRPVSRECGNCTACCTTMTVEELDKPAGVKCEHVCQSGCSIYTSRPASCSNWECLWLGTSLPDGFRPDKIGVVFAPQKTGSFKTHGVHVVGALESWPSAARMPKGEKAIRWLNSRGIGVLLIRCDEVLTTLYPGAGTRPEIERALSLSMSVYQWNGSTYQIRSRKAAIAELQKNVESKRAKGVSK